MNTAKIKMTIKPKQHHKRSAQVAGTLVSCCVLVACNFNDTKQVGSSKPTLTESIQPESATGLKQQKLVKGQQHMVATANPYASNAAINILRAGGSALDAAIAAQWVLTLVEPQSSGLGGGLFLLHYRKLGARIEAYDGRETAGP
jgi:hypothetical protein